MIKVEYDRKARLGHFSEKDVNDAVSVLMGIAFDTCLSTPYGYCVGNRNNFAVDLSLCCYVLGLDVKRIAIDLLSEKEDMNYALLMMSSDLEDRIDTIDGYLFPWKVEFERKNYPMTYMDYVGINIDRYRDDSTSPRVNDFIEVIDVSATTD